MTQVQSRNEARSTPAVSLEGICYSYESGVTALEDLTLSIERGKSVGIVGPSGCGKSTLLLMLAGLRRPESGHINWSPELTSSAGHRLSMMFQQDTLLPWKTVLGNIELYAKFNRGIDRAADADRIKHLVAMASLGGFEQAYPYQLSGGMRRRAAFLSALAPSPKVLLLDEPFAALDEPTRLGIHQEVFEILRDLKTTMILVTHDLAETISLCDEVVILKNRPGSVFSRHEVPFGDDRNMLELRHEPEFLELYGTLWEDLSAQISATPARGQR